MSYQPPREPPADAGETLPVLAYRKPAEEPAGPIVVDVLNGVLAAGIAVTLGALGMFAFVLAFTDPHGWMASLVVTPALVFASLCFAWSAWTSFGNYARRTDKRAQLLGYLVGRTVGRNLRRRR